MTLLFLLVTHLLPFEVLFGSPFCCFSSQIPDHWNYRLCILKKFSQDEKKSFFMSLPSSKLTISLISIYKHYAVDIADPSSMQVACHMNFVIDLAHRGGSVVEHRSTESKGLRFDSLWGLIIVSLSHARDETKKHFFLIMWKLQESEVKHSKQPKFTQRYFGLDAQHANLLSSRYLFTIRSRTDRD